MALAAGVKSALLANLVGDDVRLLPVQVGDGHVGAIAGQPERDRPPIPCPPPVTSATLPSIRMSYLGLRRSAISCLEIDAAIEALVGRRVIPTMPAARAAAWPPFTRWSQATGLAGVSCRSYV